MREEELEVSSESFLYSLASSEEDNNKSHFLQPLCVPVGSFFHLISVILACHSDFELTIYLKIFKGKRKKRKERNYQQLFILCLLFPGNLPSKPKCL
jgi:hypothetical protein